MPANDPLSLEARDFMTRDVVTVRPDETIPTVARILADNALGAVPVCENGGTLIGMVSEGDLMRPFWQDYGLHRAWWLEMLAEGEDLAEAVVDYIGSDISRVQDIMTRPPVTAPETATAREIAGLLVRHGIKRVPIVRDGVIVGIVSRANLIDLIASDAGLRPQTAQQR